eukprot:COSAG03_NODE_129_length_12045_cov_19.842625_7_plen_380_part_00
MGGGGSLVSRAFFSIVGLARVPRPPRADRRDQWHRELREPRENNSEKAEQQDAKAFSALPGSLQCPRTARPQHRAMDAGSSDAMTESKGFLARDADRDRAAREKREQREAAKLVAEAARLQSELAEVEQAVENAPEDPEVWQCRAEVYLARGRTVEALQDYKQAVALDSDRRDWMFKMWDLEKQVVDEATERARLQAEREKTASAKAAKEADAARLKREAATDREEWKAERAEQQAEAKVTTRVLQAEGLKDRANGKFKQGHYEEAMQGYTRALGKLSDETQRTESGVLIRTACLLNRAACALKLQQPESSAEDCSAVLEMDSTNAKALYRRGLAFAAMQLNDAALADLAVASQLKPDDSAIRKQIAKLKGVQAAAVEQ